MIEENVTGGDLLLAALALIRASRFGLYESELIELLAIDPIIPKGNIPPEIKFKTAAILASKENRITTESVSL